MDCEITIKGNGEGRNGHPKTDRTGPVREFLVDNGVFYRAVKKHVAKCDVCDELSYHIHCLVQCPCDREDIHYLCIDSHLCEGDDLKRVFLWMS